MCRADHNLQDIRANIFPFKRQKVNAPEVVPSITSPVRRKERSLSSLVVDSPPVALQPSLTGRRTKVTARRASTLRGLGPIIDKPKKEVNSAEVHAENSNQNRRQVKKIQVSSLMYKINAVLMSLKEKYAVLKCRFSSIAVLIEYFFLLRATLP